MPHETLRDTLGPAAGSTATALPQTGKRAEARALLNLALTRLFPGRIALVSSFGAESPVLLHMVSRIDPTTPVIFLDTGKLFTETLAYRDALTGRLGLSDVRSISPDAGSLSRVDPSGTLWRHAPDLCCRVRKVVPLERALQPFDAWINGRKRAHGGERCDLRFLEADRRWVKFNPLADWDGDDVARYLSDHDLPVHPLVAAGFPSIGCAPCTTPVGRDEDVRSGRWRGSDKRECGIHFSPDGRIVRQGQ